MANSESQARKSTIAGFTQEVFTRWTAIEKLDTELAASWRQVTSDELSRFRLWSNNLGSCHGVDDPRSADHRLRTALDVQRRIVQLLEELCENLDDIQAIQSGSRQGEEEEPENVELSSDEDGTTVMRSEISELWLMVEDVITNLMKITVLVRKSTTRNRFDHAVRAATKSKGSSIPTIWYTEHVRRKFPKLEGKQWLIERLGENGAHRRTFLMYAQDHEKRLASDEHENDANKSVTSRPTQASTRASTLAPAKVEHSVLQRLEEYNGDDAVSTTSATTYNTAAGDGNDANVLRVRPLSSVCTQGRPAVCPYCRAMVHFKREKAWRRHIYDDLKAYSCTFEHCDNGPFGSRTAWAAHERRYHLRLWRCHICTERFDSHDHVISHVATEHPSVDTAITSALAYAQSSEIERLPLSQCPFCDDHHLQKGAAAPYASSTLQGFAEHDRAVRDTSVPLALYHRHMSKHMEQLALFSVPSAANDEDDENEDGETGGRSSQIASDQNDTVHSARSTTEHSPVDYTRSAEDAIAAHEPELALNRAKLRHDSEIVREELPGGPETISPAKAFLQGWNSSDQTSESTILSNLNPVFNAGPRVRGTSESSSSSRLGEMSVGQVSETGEDDQMEDPPADTTSSDQHDISPHLSPQSRSVEDLTDEHGATGPEELMAQPESILERFGGFPKSPHESVATTASASQEGTSLPLLPHHEPAHRVNRSGTAVYELPPSLVMQRADENERRPVSFERDSADQTTHRRRPSLTVHTEPRQNFDTPSGKGLPGLSRLPSLRHQRTDKGYDQPTQTFPPKIPEDEAYVDRETARETARRQKALDEAILRRQEDLEALEKAQLDREADRARYQNSFDPLQKMPDSRYPLPSKIDSSWTRRSDLSAPPSRPPPVRIGTRFASSSPFSPHGTHRRRQYGHTILHQYVYPDSPTSTSRRPSDSIRERGREVIERERAIAAAAAEDQAGEHMGVETKGRLWDFDEVEECSATANITTSLKRPQGQRSGGGGIEMTRDDERREEMSSSDDI